MQQIGMKEEHVAGIHFDVDQFHAFQDFSNAFDIGTGLVAGQLVMDPATVMGAPDDLQTTVLPRGRVTGDEGTDQVRR